MLSWISVDRRIRIRTAPMGCHLNVPAPSHRPRPACLIKSVRNNTDARVNCKRLVLAAWPHVGVAYLFCQPCRPERCEVNPSRATTPRFGLCNAPEGLERQAAALMRGGLTAAAWTACHK